MLQSTPQSEQADETPQPRVIEVIEDEFIQAEAVHRQDNDDKSTEVTHA
jgi:hypothetical protein